ncbi:MAG: AraC family transcriptional regulator [Tunicatimonas sp.]
MKKLTLHIKDMICPRCETVIRQEMDQLKARVVAIKPGYATVEVPTSVGLNLIAEKLRRHGFELLEDPEKRLVEQIKITTMDYLYRQQDAATNGEQSSPLSEFLFRSIGRSYSHLSKLFSKHEGKTLEHYYIHLRIERVKELLDYQELNISEIADKLGYSSGHYLSAQFRKVTGRSISNYRKDADTIGRNYLNEL